MSKVCNSLVFHSVDRIPRADNQLRTVIFSDESVSLIKMLEKKNSFWYGHQEIHVFITNYIKRACCLIYNALHRHAELHTLCQTQKAGITIVL